jgi:hypothetical protein
MESTPDATAARAAASLATCAARADGDDASALDENHGVPDEAARLHVQQARTPDGDELRGGVRAARRPQQARREQDGDEDALHD